jgi:hypothetical protein
MTAFFFNQDTPLAVLAFAVLFFHARRFDNSPPLPR